MYEVQGRAAEEQKYERTLERICSQDDCWGAHTGICPSERRTCRGGRNAYELDCGTGAYNRKNDRNRLPVILRA